MWYLSEGARIAAINGVVLSKLMIACEHRTQPPIQKFPVRKRIAYVFYEMRNCNLDAPAVRGPSSKGPGGDRRGPAYGVLGRNGEPLG